MTEARTVDPVFCRGCGAALPRRPKSIRGRKREWCSERCRNRARKRATREARRREEPASVWETAVPRTVLPAQPDSLSRQEEVLRAAAALLDGQPARPPIDQLAEAAQMQRELAWALERLGREEGLPGPLRAAAGVAAQHAGRAFRSLQADEEG